MRRHGQPLFHAGAHVQGYRILEALGAGGMGEVYRVDDAGGSREPSGSWGPRWRRSRSCGREEIGAITSAVSTLDVARP